jgi:NADP-dependent 3-hydroxy acid dehydrogenase YdfG
MGSKLAVVTGASKGIGRSVAKKLAKSGLNIFATARNVTELESLKKEIEDQSGNCIIYPAELTAEDEFDLLVKEIIRKDVKISLLVHSAGIVKIGTVEKMSFSDWQTTIDVNLSSPFQLSQKCIPHLARNAHIFFINSVAGNQTFSEWSAYCASKSGLRALADTLRQELAPRGIKVTSIYPASVDTPMQDKIPYDWDRSKMLSPDDVAEALVNCYQQPAHVQIKDIHLENLAGTF